MHILKEAAPINYASLDVADEILISVVQHVDECSIDEAKIAMKINANRMLDEEAYAIMKDVPTRQFDFVVKQAEVEDVDALGPPVNAFDVLRLAYLESTCSSPRHGPRTIPPMTTSALTIFEVV